jgi:Zn-dependent metalloprotease
MKMPSLKLAALWLLFCPSLSVGQDSTAAPVQETADALPDPTAVTRQFEQRLRRSQEPSDQREPANNNKSKDELQDPTRLNENFRDALKHVTSRTAGAGNAVNVPAAPNLPDISLAASACNMHKGKNHAMLRVNGKTEMVSVNDKITFIEKNQLIEIQVLEIQKDHVQIRLFPSNETIILR